MTGRAASYAEALRRLTAVAGIAGLGFGLRETEGLVTAEPAWRVYVLRKRPLRSLAPRERVPARLLDLPTDVIEAAPARCAAASHHAPPDGTAIANGRGVPGSLGCIARLRRTGEPVLLSSYHVLFARRGKRGDPIWSVADTPRVIGRVLSGKAGVVAGIDPPTFVDAATGTLVDRDAVRGAATVGAVAHANAGDAVTKRGAASGRTQGIVVDVAYPDHWYWEYRSASAPRQLLIRSTSTCEAPFASTGDSGAVARNACGESVGVLWGTTARGDGVASPMHAVAQALGLAAP